MRRRGRTLQGGGGVWRLSPCGAAAGGGGGAGALEGRGGPRIGPGIPRQLQRPCRRPRAAHRRQQRARGWVGGRGTGAEGAGGAGGGGRRGEETRMSALEASIEPKRGRVNIAPIIAWIVPEIEKILAAKDGISVSCLRPRLFARASGDERFN